jgi:hypothetical protein
MSKLVSPSGLWPTWVRRCMGVCILLLASCGGGGGDPGSPSGGGAGAGQAGVGSGGTGSYSNGPITGFGSIIVNEVHYDHESPGAVIDKDDDDGEDNGTEHTPGDLKLGMTVEVDVAPGGTLSIRFGSDLLGQVQSLPATVPDAETSVGVSPKLHPRTLMVMGHNVLVDDKTYVGDELEKLRNLHVDDVVEIYGYEDLKFHVYRATRIERKESAVKAYVVRGVIENLSTDGTSISCDIAGQHIAYAASTASSAIANGMVARFELMTASSADGWVAKRMNVNAPLAASDRTDATVTGLVTKVDASAMRFSVNGIPVDASLMHIGSPALGDAVTVRGSLVNGTVKATEVTARLP